MISRKLASMKRKQVWLFVFKANRMLIMLKFLKFNQLKYHIKKMDVFKVMQLTPIKASLETITKIELVLLSILKRKGLELNFLQSMTVMEVIYVVTT